MTERIRAHMTICIVQDLQIRQLKVYTRMYD